MFNDRETIPVRLTLCMAPLLSATLLLGAPEEQSSDVISSDFLKSLNEASELVSREKLNIDKVPSTVTVIRRKTIVASGAATLMDILKLVPGIDIAMSASGKWQVVVRGVRSKYRDKFKLLINGVDVTSNLYSNQFYYYNFPASLIDRVEVTKTPDAILYGSNAFHGVVNVITLDRDDNNQLYLMGSDQKRAIASIFQKVSIADGTLSIDAHYSHLHPDIDAPTTMMIAGKGARPFRQSVSASTEEKNAGLGVAFQMGSWKARYRLQQYTKENFFGLINIPPLVDDRDVTMRHQTLDLSYDTYLSPQTEWNTDLVLTHYTWDGDYRAMPDIHAPNDPNRDLVIGAFIREVSVKATSWLKHHGDRHDLMAQLEAGYAKPKKMYYLQHRADEPGDHLTGEDNILKEGIDRKTFAIAIEDLFTINDTHSLVAGLRYDHYNDFGNHLAWKAGSVNQIGLNDTLKLLYNHAFRAPSWAELYSNAAAEFVGNPNLKSENIDLIEGVWLHRFSDKDMLKTNLFYGRIHDVIVKANGSYENGDAMTIRGFELSYRRSVSETLAWGADVSYSDNKDPSLKMIHNDVRDWLARAHMQWEPLANLLSYTWVEYASPIEMPSIVEDIDGYWLLNETVTWTKGAFRIQGGVRNLLDSDVRYLTAPAKAGPVMFVPEKGYIPSIGREWFVSVAVRW